MLFNQRFKPTFQETLPYLINYLKLTLQPATGVVIKQLKLVKLVYSGGNFSTFQNFTSRLAVLKTLDCDETDDNN